jgi:hypothetical protein
MSEKGGNGNDQKRVVEVFTLNSNQLMEAVIHYMLQRYGKGRVVEVQWVLTPEEGYTMPPIKDIAANCTVEPKP